MKFASLFSYLSWPLLAVVLALVYSGDAMAKKKKSTATDVKCKKACISTKEISDGAVDAAKMSASMRAGGAQTVTVNCPGDSIQDAIDNSVPGSRLVVTVNGTCGENVFLRHQLITLKGGTDGVIQGVAASPGNESFESPLNISSSDVVLQDLTISGGSNGNFGILIADGANVWVENVTVEDADRDGILVAENSNLDLINSMVQDSGGAGVTVVDNSHADLEGSSISGGASDGLIVVRGSSSKLLNSSIDADGDFACAAFIGDQSVLRMNGGNTLSNDALSWNCATLTVHRNSTVRIQGSGNSISNSDPVSANSNGGAAGGFALDTEMVSSVRIDGSDAATITGNVYSYNLSTVDLRKVEVTGNIYSDGLSANVRLRGNDDDDVIVNGNVYPGSFVDIRNNGEVVINGDIDCTNSDAVRDDFAHFDGGGDYVNCPW